MNRPFMSHLLVLASSALLAIPAVAAPGGWMPIHTHAPDASSAVAGAGMQSGETMSIAVSLQVRNKDGLDALTDDLVTGRSAATVSSAQFMSQYAPTQAQVDAVVKHLSDSGYINIDVSANHLLITADGSAGTAQKAFKVHMRHYSVNDRSAYANVNDPVVPAAPSASWLSISHSAVSEVDAVVLRREALDTATVLTTGVA